MQCEMCGKETSLFKADVEGSLIKVCKNCSSYGKIISAVRKAPTRTVREEKIFITPRKKSETIHVIADNYGDIIKGKREKLGLKQEELAKRIAEKESLLHNIESGKFEPNIELARKFERFLRIKLVEEHEEKNVELRSHDKSGNLTIGDLIKIRKRPSK